MIAKINNGLKNRFKARILKKHAHKSTLDDLYIFPSGFGLGCGFVIVTTAIGAINYQVNSAFLLVFLGLSLGIICIWETHKNLKGLTIQCLPIDDVQVGQPVKIILLVQGKELSRYSIEFCLEHGEPVKLERLTKEDEQVVIALPTQRRGRFHVPVIKIYTLFPLGIVRAWSYLLIDKDYFVYPEPEPPGFWPAPSDTHNKQQQQLLKELGDEDLYELKSIKDPWVQPGRIAWKTSARGQGWFLKTMNSPIGENWVFRIEDLARGDIELNLKQLSFWIQTAEQRGHLYALELNGELTEMGQGTQHMKTCLRRLATY